MAKNSRARIEANARWEKKAYDRFVVRVPKGHKAIIQSAADAARQSFNGYVTQAIDERMGRVKGLEKNEEE